MPPAHGGVRDHSSSGSRTGRSTRQSARDAIEIGAGVTVKYVLADGSMILRIPAINKDFSG